MRSFPLKNKKKAKSHHSPPSPRHKTHPRCMVQKKKSGDDAPNPNSAKE
jgi:hypothetical protein